MADQQDARTQSEDKYKLALVELEKLKAELERTQADQSAALKRAEKAEAKLATVQQELSGLKRHISNMTQAIFGKLYLTLQPYPLPWANSLMLTYRLSNPRLESRQSARRLRVDAESDLYADGTAVHRQCADR